MTGLLVIDIGNTRISCGVYFQGEILLQKHFSRLTLKGLKDFLKGKEILGCVFASVVPKETEKLKKIWPKISKSPLCRLNWEIVEKAVKNKIKVNGMTPGDDRAANAYLLCKRGAFPAVSVDAGTALTAEVLDKKGVFLGGLIAPGDSLQRMSLKIHTAQLKNLRREKTLKLIGDSSEAAISAGIDGLLVLGLVSWLAKTEKEVLKEKFKAIVFTGGGAEPYYKEALKNFRAVLMDPAFTLKALGFSFYDEKVRKLYAKFQNVKF